MTRIFNDVDRDYALRQILDIPHDAVIPPSAIEVWERFNERKIRSNVKQANDRARLMAHVQWLESKLTQRREEYTLDNVIAVVFSADLKQAFGVFNGTNLVMPRVWAQRAETPGELATGVAQRMAGVYATAPSQFVVQRVEQRKVNMVNVIMFCRAIKPYEQPAADFGHGDIERGFYNLDDERFSESQRTLFADMLSVSGYQ